MSVTLDMSQVRALVADFKAAPADIARKVPPVVKRGANNIKDQLREEMAGSEHFGQVAAFITYDEVDGGFAAEIGPEARGAGLLENIAYFGTSRGGGTVPPPEGALQAEAPRFLAAMADLVVGVLR